MSPADGLIGGTGTVNAEQFGDEAARVLVANVAQCLPVWANFSF